MSVGRLHGGGKVGGGWPGRGLGAQLAGVEAGPWGDYVTGHLHRHDHYQWPKPRYLQCILTFVPNLTKLYFEITLGQVYNSTTNIFGLVKVRVLDNLFVSKGLAAYSLDISYIFSMTWWWISLYGVKSEFFHLTFNREETYATFSQYLKMSRICRTKQASCAASLTPSPPSRQLLPCLRTLTLLQRSPWSLPSLLLQCCGGV